MPISSGSRRVGAVNIAIALVGVIAAIALGAGTPSTPPSASPSPSPTAPPSGSPSSPPSADGEFRVDVDVFGVPPVTLIVKDPTGGVVDVRSGPARDGMSVPWGEVGVANFDAHTLRVTWGGLPRTEEIELVVREQGDTLVLDMVQLLPPSDADSIGFDRVVFIEFDRNVSAKEVVAIFPEPLPA